MLKLISFLIVLSCLNACHEPPQNESFVPVVGLNANGKSEVNYVPTASFQQEMSPILESVSREVENTLEQNELSVEMPWQLSRVTVGLALETEFELFEERPHR